MMTRESGRVSMRKFIIILIILAIAEISLSLYLTMWREEFWNSIVAKDSHVFLTKIGIFSIVALTLCFITGYSGYLVSRAAIAYRGILNTRALALATSNLENASQRCQEDCRDYPDLLLNLVYGLIKAVCYVTVFTVSLLAGFAWYYLLALVVYGIIGTYLTKKVAYPLIRLNYQTQRAEASYRSNLTATNFSSCISLMLSLALKQKYLSYLQSFYSQVGVVIPLILVAPMYFTGSMSVGSLMRFNSLSSTILENLSYGVTSFGMFNRLLSCRSRLKEMGVIL